MLEEGGSAYRSIKKFEWNVTLFQYHQLNAVTQKRRTKIGTVVQGPVASSNISSQSKSTNTMISTLLYSDYNAGKK